MLLIHKDIPFADVSIHDGMIVVINKILNRDHYPPGIFIEHKNHKAISIHERQ